MSSTSSCPVDMKPMELKREFHKLSLYAKNLRCVKFAHYQGSLWNMSYTTVLPIAMKSN